MNDSLRFSQRYQTIAVLYRRLRGQKPPRKSLQTINSRPETALVPLVASTVAAEPSKAFSYARRAMGTVALWRRILLACAELKRFAG